MVAIIRTRYANLQIERLGLKRGYDRKVCMAAAIVMLAGFELGVIVTQSDPAVPRVGWLISIGFYMVYLALIAIALRRVHETRPLDADYWTSRPGDK